MHYSIPGMAPDTDTGEAEAVVAEIYVKLVRNVTARQYRGVIFFSTIEPKHTTAYDPLPVKPALLTATLLLV